MCHRSEIRQTVAAFRIGCRLGHTGLLACSHRCDRCYSSLGQHAASDALEFGRAHGVSKSAYSKSSRQPVHFKCAFRRHQRMFILRHLGSAVRATSWAFQVYGPTVAYHHTAIWLEDCGDAEAADLQSILQPKSSVAASRSLRSAAAVRVSHRYTSQRLRQMR